MKYRTIVADPPWDYGKDASRWLPNRNRAVRLEIPFQPLSAGAIAALPVSELANATACLWLWTTSKHLPEAFGVISAWGFAYRQTIVWAKKGSPPFGGSVCANAAEFLLFAKRGNPTVGRWRHGSVITAPRALRHSRKPETFLDLIEQISPSPRLELFARRQRLGWDAWGDEVESDLVLEAM